MSKISGWFHSNSKFKKGMRQMKNGFATANFEECGIGDEEAILIAEELKVNITVSRLWLYGNNITDVGTIDIAEALKVNSTVEKISLTRNNISNEGAIAIAEALEVNSTLIELGFGSTQMANEGAIAIAEAVRLNTSLVNLYLHNNQITNEGAFAIAEMLNYNQTLVEVYLGQNPIPAKGRAALEPFLGDCTTNRIVKEHLTTRYEKETEQCFFVTTLDDKQVALSLSESSYSFKYLCQSITKTTGIPLDDKRFNLTHCVNDEWIPLADESSFAEYLQQPGEIRIESIAFNTALSDIMDETVTTVNLSSCYVTDTQCIALAKAVQFNDSLLVLNLADNPRITETGKNALIPFLDFHTWDIIVRVAKKEMIALGHVTAERDAIQRQVETLEVEVEVLKEQMDRMAIEFGITTTINQSDAKPTQGV